MAGVTRSTVYGFSITGASLNSGGGGSTWPPVAMTNGTLRSRSLRRDRPDVLAFQVHVKDGEVEAASLDLLQRALNRIAGPSNRVAERIEEVLEHHGDERLVFDDQDGTLR